MAKEFHIKEKYDIEDLISIVALLQLLFFVHRAVVRGTQSKLISQ